MASLVDIKPGSRVAGLAPGAAVDVVSVEWIGNQDVNAVYRSASGSAAETTLYSHDEHRLDIETVGRRWSLDADGGLLRLVTEANRIKLAHFFDPYLATHTSLVNPLPLPTSDVYGEMITRQPLRFLLAADPCADGSESAIDTFKVCHEEIIGTC